MLDYKDIQGIDLKLCLLSGSNLKVENLVIKPYTLAEVKEYGYTNYIKNLQLISISLDDFISSVQDEGKRKILEEQRTNLRTFDFYIKFGGSELLEKLINALKMIFRTEDVRMLDDKVVAINFVRKEILKFENDKLIVNSEKLKDVPDEEMTIVHRDNFDDIVEVIKFQNYLEKPINLNKEEIYADEETRKLAEQMEKNREKVEAKKKAQRQIDDEDDIDISDIISAVSSKSNSINKLNIWNFTLYQIYDEYSRLELIDNYDFSIKAIMSGAEKIDLRHWSSKI